MCRLRFIPRRFLSDLRQYRNFYLIAVGCPNARLIVEYVYRQACRDGHLCQELRERYLLFILRRSNQFRDDLLNDLRVEEDVGFLCPFLVRVEVVGRSRPRFSARGVPRNVICDELLSLAFFCRFQRFLSGHVTSRLRVRADVRHLRYYLFEVNDGTVYRRFNCQDPI